MNLWLPALRAAVRRGSGWWLSRCALATLLALAGPSCAPPADRSAAPGNTATTTLIRGALVFDGTGSPGHVGDVRIADGRVSELSFGENLEELSEEKVVQAKGLVLAPGFVDTHSHHDGGLSEDASAWQAISQGITTIVVGNDGSSHLPLSDWFARIERSPVAVNVASYSGHNSLRAEVLGENFQRSATGEEIAAMQALLEADLAAGALGLSSGLEYEPGLYSDRAEVVALAKVAAGAGGRYISHLRSEDRELLAAIDEILFIGREAELPVQISHFKLAMKSLWGRAGEILATLDAARAAGIEVTADVYPYSYWQSTMTVLFPERRFTEEAARFALEELAPPEGMWIAAFAPQPDLVGLTMSEIARAMELPPHRAYLQLIERAAAWREEHPEATEAAESIIATSMLQSDIDALLRWPHSNVCSDGALQGRHPRGVGTYPRILGRYVRERGVLSLAEAIHKMTGLAARNVGLDRLEPARGALRPGAAADLVLFDPAAILDQATPEEPLRDNAGIHAVWVNGHLVVSEGSATGRAPGQVLRRAR